MTLRIFVIGIQFIFIGIALLSQCLFQKVVVFKSRFDGYSRFSFGFVSLAMICLTATSGLAYSDALSAGMHLDNATVFETPRNNIPEYIRSYSAFSLGAAGFLSTFERTINITVPKFHSSKLFLCVFIALFLLTQFGAIWHVHLTNIVKLEFSPTFFIANGLEFLNVIMLFLLYHYSKRMYSKTRGTVGLEYRYQLFESCRWCRCVIPSTVFSAICKVIMLSQFFLITDETRQSYFSVFIDLLLNIYCVIFPCAVFLNHQQIKKQIVTTVCFGIRRANQVDNVVRNPKPEQETSTSC